MITVMIIIINSIAVFIDSAIVINKIHYWKDLYIPLTKPYPLQFYLLSCILRRLHLSDIREMHNCFEKGLDYRFTTLFS